MLLHEPMGFHVTCIFVVSSIEIKPMYTKLGIAFGNITGSRKQPVLGFGSKSEILRIMLVI